MSKTKKKVSDSVPAVLGGKPAFEKPVPITKPTLPKFSSLKKGYEDVLESGMLTNSKNVQEFEKRAAEYLGVRNAVALNSCTSGMMLAMKVLGLKGEVILPSFTFHATAHAVVWNGLKPVFVDCNPDTYNIDIAEIEKAITPRTSAILAVHIFGNPADVENLESVAKKNNLKLLFDAAHGFGARRKGKSVGCYGNAESFSLSPTKLITTAEGGILATNDDELAKNMKVARNYGDSGDYDCAFSGFNARMNEFNAILGIESLKMIEKNVKTRHKMADIYKKMLGSIPGIKFQEIAESDRSSYKDFSILIDEDQLGIVRDTLHDALLAENIVVKKYFYPAVHKQKAFKEYNSIVLKNTEYVADNALSLPLYSHIDASAVKKISNTLLKILNFKSEIKKRLNAN